MAENMSENKDDSNVPELEDSLNIEDTQERPREKSKKKLVYDLFKTFDNQIDAESYITEEKCWSIKTRSQTEEGEKVFYRYNRVKARGEQCSSRMYLLYDCTSFRVDLFRSVSDHNCETIPNKAGSLMTDEVKRLIEQLSDQRKKTLAIIDHLVLAKLPVPKSYQIANHLAKYKKIKYGPTTLNQSELRSILSKYKDLPEKKIPIRHLLCRMINAKWRFSGFS